MSDPIPAAARPIPTDTAAPEEEPPGASAGFRLFGGVAVAGCTFKPLGLYAGQRYELTRLFWRRRGVVAATPEEETAARLPARTVRDPEPTGPGIEAAVIASDPSLTPDFARPEADLEIVFFSDEDDHGDRSLGSTLSALQNPRADGVVRATALVGDAPEGCASLIAAADPGFRYIELQEATAGLRGSICSPDYDAMLLRAGLSALGLTDRFVFSQFPDTTSLEVFVGEEAVPHDAEPGWTYEIGDNTLRFDLDAIPDPGVTIYATYKPFVGYLIEPDAD